MNHRVQKFSSLGTYLSQFGTVGSDNGQFIQPEGIAIDNSGNIYVSDTKNNRIQKFAPACTQQGIDSVKANPGNYGLFTQAQLDAAKQAATQSCKDNPASCGLFSQTQIDAAKQTGIQSCKDNPASCSLFNQAQIDTARQSGIDLAKAKPGDYGLFNQTQLDTAVSTATASMYTEAQLDQAVKTEQLKWDANGDGRIGLEDIIRMLQVLAGLRP